MREILEEALYLQQHWCPTNTPETERRGFVVRHSLPHWLRTFGGTLAEEAGVPRRQLKITGTDGQNHRAELPRVLLATGHDWYAAYLFSARGDRAYLALCHPAPPAVPEAHPLLATRPWQTTADLSPYRSRLGRTYEATVALALEYHRGSVPETDTLAADAVLTAALLRILNCGVGG
ncbi:hypothetical protein ABT095_02460 [Kitasatospora sp. NPDC002227]|uniref:hypothetical protein n=1 Tax=Kitasatospora sp. NPDC002227 TaxID=3154773 RepID=UPI003323497B